jgi:hypothetical protein
LLKNGTGLETAEVEKTLPGALCEVEETGEQQKRKRL